MKDKKVFFFFAAPQITAKHIGVAATISLDHGEQLTGWIKGQIPQGLLVSLDLEGNNVRLVETRWSPVDFHWKRPKATFALTNGEGIEERLQALEVILKERLHEPLNEIDYKQLRQIALQAEAIRVRIQDSGVSSVDLEHANLGAALSLSNELYSALATSGVGSALGSIGSELARLPKQYALPSSDAPLAADLIQDLEGDDLRSPWTLTRQKVLADAASDQLAQLPASALARLEPTKSTVSAKHRLFGSGTSTSKIAGASLRIAAGTGLTVGNLALGVSAGLAATLFSVGATALPVYVGLATSAYTGLVQIADGLEKISGSAKSPT